MIFREDDYDNMVLTFEEFLRRTPFAQRMTEILRILEEKYHSPVDTEFALQIVNPDKPQPEVQISILQCRPQSHLQELEAKLPQNLNDEDVIFATTRMAPEGRVSDIRYIIFVVPEQYYALPSSAARGQLGRMIGRLNAKLEDQTFICVGPGRWGTNNPDLGVNIGYGDIYHTRALIELTGQGIGPAPEASFGTHFFQDLVESNIYPLAIYLGDKDVIFNRSFFYDTPNQLTSFIQDTGNLEDCLRVIDVTGYHPGHCLELVMDGESGRSAAFLEVKR
jgi:hypothetical protein